MTFAESHSLEDAIVATKFGRASRLLIVVSGLVLACSNIEAISVNLALPILECEFGMTNFHKGLLGSVHYIGIIVSSHFWGFLADTRGRKKVIVSALLLAFVSSAFSTLVKNYWLLLFFRFCTGFFICSPQGIQYTYMGEFHSARYRAKALMTASVIYGICCLISPLNGVLFLNRASQPGFYIPLLGINYSNWRIFLLACALPSVISAILVTLFIPESPRFTYAQGDEERTLKILSKIYKWNTGVSEFPVKSLVKDEEFQGTAREARNAPFLTLMWSQTVQIFSHPHLRNTLTACFLQFAICVTGNGFWTFFPDIVNKVTIWLDSDDVIHARSTICEIVSKFDASLSQAGQPAEPAAAHCVTQLQLGTFQNVAIFATLHTFGWLIISIVINRTGKLLVIVFVMFMCGTASILLMFVDYPRIALYIYVMMLTSGLNMSVINSSTVELFPTSLRAMAVSISLMMGRVGSVAGSNFVGLSIERFCTYTWALPATLTIAGGLLAFTIPNIGKRNKEQ